MVNDIIVVISFVIVLGIVCKLWSFYAIKQYKKLKKSKLNLTYGVYIESKKKLEIVGVGNDGNGDYEVAYAIKKIDLPNDIRIKVNE